MSKRKRDVNYLKPEEPSFITRMKAQAGYKEGPTVDTKREALTLDDEDSDYSGDEDPQVVVVTEGDLTAEEASQAKRDIEEGPADLNQRVVFRKPEKAKKDVIPSSESSHVDSAVPKKQKGEEKIAEDKKSGSKPECLKKQSKTKSVLSFTEYDELVMGEGNVGCINPIFKNKHSELTVTSEMDYSLLASNLQKFLNISYKDVSHSRPSRHINTSVHSVVQKTKSRYTYLEDIDEHKCPLCPARFNAKYLLAKHALRIHQKAVLVSLQEGSSQQHLKCRFCVHKVMHKHQKLLFLHLEKKHATEFVSYFKQSLVPSAVGSGHSKDGDHQGPLNINILQQDFESMSVSDFKDNVSSNVNVNMNKHELNEPGENGEISCAPLLKPENFEGTLFVCMAEGKDVNLPRNLMASSCHAKRKLDLDGSADGQANRSRLMKENIPPKESLSMTLAGSGWKHAIGRPFACGRCKEAFSCNALMLDHVSVRHRGPLRLLQPLFTCGLCSASFYKNSFLVRHCYQHHTPKRT